MPSTRRTFLGTLAVGATAGVAGCSSSCPDSDAPTPTTVFGSGDAGQGFETPPDSSWPAPRFDAGNTGYAPSRRPPVDSPTVRWRRTLSAPRVDGGGTTSAPVVADGSVYLLTGAGAVALALRDGRVRWRADDVTPVTVPDTTELAPPVVDGGRVYLSTADGVVALHADDGTTAWRHGTAATGVPTVTDDSVLVPTPDGLAALDPRDGSRRWLADVAATRPAVADGTVVASDEETVALDAATGDRVWSASVQAETYPVAADGFVYLGAYSALVALGLDDGDERWRVDRGGGRTFSAPVVTRDTIYAVERPGEAPAATFALDRATDPPDPRWCSYVGEGTVAAATGDHAFTLQDAGGRPSPRLVAFTARFGEASWGYAAGSQVLSPAILDGGSVAVTRRGTVVGIGTGGD